MTTATDWTLSSSAADNVTDLYAQLLTIKSGKRGCLRINKKHAKAHNIEWSFVENACTILGLKLEDTKGRNGWMVGRY